jgi:hypothetical protein
MKIENSVRIVRATDILLLDARPAWAVQLDCHDVVFSAAVEDTGEDEPCSRPWQTLDIVTLTVANMVRLESHGEPLTSARRLTVRSHIGSVRTRPEMRARTPSGSSCVSMCAFSSGQFAPITMLL